LNLLLCRTWRQPPHWSLTFESFFAPKTDTACRHSIGLRYFILLSRQSVAGHRTGRRTFKLLLCQNWRHAPATALTINIEFVIAPNLAPATASVGRRPLNLLLYQTIALRCRRTMSKRNIIYSSIGMCLPNHNVKQQYDLCTPINNSIASNIVRCWHRAPATTLVVGI